MIGPMRLRKDGRWDSRDHSRRSLEAAAASWVVRSLEEGGHRIDDVWSPDYERERRPELHRRPDCALTIDGFAATVEVTMFATTAHSTASAMGNEIRQAVSREIRERLPEEWSVLGHVVYQEELLLARGKARRQRDARDLTDLIIATVVPEGPFTNLRLSSDVLPPWAAGASITASRRERRSVDVYVMPPRGDVAAQVDGFIEQCLESKSDQHAGWGEGILAVVHGFHESAEDLRAGFERRSDCPWWRVYWVPAGPPPILVWDSGPSAQPNRDDSEVAPQRQAPTPSRRGKAMLASRRPV